ncbi:MAG: 1-deoxy-D-xylulose-5-phosphate synthase [Solirubrobacterales bacterium]|nr:1-deoxy-D-xylulose-5-phosphate synthase [Solirubrobacterales bacterium]
MSEKTNNQGPLLPGIDSPADLRGLSDEQLQQVAEETRAHIIEVIGEIGGHFGANLGTCEIAVALHSLLESPRDKILWDVGHQAYPHKILTGRRDQLATIRQYGGLAPFCSIPESEHDIMGAGHASTSISYGLGLKEAMRKGIGPDGRVVAVIGDGALTGGVAYEAMHAAGGLQTPMVILLNDNGMSISPNVGALSSYFQRARLKPGLFHAREEVEDRLTRLPLGLGKRFERLGPELKSAIKAYWAPGLLFEELDLAYMGVIDGHDVAALRRALAEALAADRPVVVHVHTVKGRGFAPAEEGGLAGMEEWHAAKPGSIVDGAPAGSKPKLVPVQESDAPASIAPEILETAKPESAPPQYTKVFSDAIVRDAEADPRVIGITAAMAGGAGLQKLADERPDQYYDVGIAEQNAVLMACGIALQGGKPVCGIYSTFLQRAYDQIVHDVCLQGLDVTFAMDRAGLVGDDGPTHHGSFDIAYFRSLPNVVVMAPRDEAMLVHMLHTAVALDGPAALRYPRGAAVGVPLPDHADPIPVGTGETLVNGEGIALVGYGSGVGIGLEAARILEESGIRPTVADARFVKPLDAELVERLALGHDLIVTIEEGVLQGGFGSAVIEHLEDNFNNPGGRARVMRVGLPDRFVTHGKPGLLHEEVGFTPAAVAERVLAAVKQGVAARH